MCCGKICGIFCRRQMKCDRPLGVILRVFGIILALCIFIGILLGMGLLQIKILGPNINIITGEMSCDDDTSKMCINRKCTKDTCIYRGCNLNHNILMCCWTGTISTLILGVIIFGCVGGCICSRNRIIDDYKNATELANERNVEEPETDPTPNNGTPLLIGWDYNTKIKS